MMNISEKCFNKPNPYSSTDNFLSPIPVSDWLLFCCKTLTINQKRKMKMIKTQILWRKTIKIAKEVYINIKLHLLFSITNKIYETISRNQAKLGKAKKRWYLFLGNLWPLWMSGSAYTKISPIFPNFLKS